MCSFSLNTFYISKASYFILAALVSLFFVHAEVAIASTLSFSPTGGEHVEGTTFTVGVYAGSAESSVNAVSGIVSYPQDKLELVSISKNQSIVSLWVQEPSFSNAAGTVNFEGIILNPGFKGSQGKILALTFRVKAKGIAPLSFTTASMLANDGEGTEILLSKGTSSFKLIPATVSLVVPKPQVPSSQTLTVAPKISSVSHIQDVWSSTTTGAFFFEFSDHTTKLRLLVDDTATSVPVVVYSPAIQNKVISDLPEGISYLHMQSFDSLGWSDVIHYKIQVDTAAPPAFLITEVAPLTFKFKAEDSLSKVVSYMVQIDTQNATPFVDDGSNTFKIATIQAGNHMLTVSAFDRAGNKTESKIAFTVADTMLMLEENNESSKSTIRQKGDLVIMILSIVIPFLALVVLLCGVLVATWRAFGGLRRHVAKEVAEAKAIMHKAFELLRSDLLEDIATLEKASKKRKLTPVEAKILKRLRNNIDEAETVIDKEISDIA